MHGFWAFKSARDFLAAFDDSVAPIASTRPRLIRLNAMLCAWLAFNCDFAALAVAFAGPVFLDDRQDDDAEGYKPGNVEERLLFIGDVTKSEHQTRPGIDCKGNGETEKQAVARLPPESQEKQRRDERCHRGRAQHD
jgi:hypothetical protein